tara:strand:- start:39 stop:263 length:225 start_codon:yes stop_codon:yes gene_type:complete
MVVPKTTALPLGYAPNFFRYTTNTSVYIVFETTVQYFGNLSFINFLLQRALFMLENIPIHPDPEPVILEKQHPF